MAAKWATEEYQPDINYKFNPDIKKFKSDYSINNIISLYNNVLEKIKLDS